MQQELTYFYNALLYYSHIPVPRGVPCDEEILSKAFRYLPLVGILLATLSALLFSLLALIFPQTLSVLLMLGSVMLLTGCLHEDGFADCCDGFGGGVTKDHILRIMKDSHMGVYGAIGLFMLLGIKILALSAMPHASIPAVFITAHGISRVLPIYMVRSETYARQGQSKAQHTRRGVDRQTLGIATVIGLLPLVFLPLTVCLVYLALACLLFLIARYYLRKKINGFTGDTLGALQQLGEILFYLVFVAVFSL